MARHRRLLEQIPAGASDSNVRFADLCVLLHELGFEQRIRGSHHIFSRDGVVEIINVQPKGDKAKPYQVKQVRSIIVRYKLAGAP